MVNKEAEKIQETSKNNFPEGTKEWYVFPVNGSLIDHIKIGEKQYSTNLINLDETDGLSIVSEEGHFGGHPTDEGRFLGL
jgi:hypothetical protein